MNLSNIPLERYRRNVPLLFAIRCLGFGIAIPIPVIIDFWSRFGITMTYVGLLEAIFAWSVVLLELPSGVFADHFGRKLSLLFGCLFWVLGTAAYVIFSSYEGFVVAEICIALGAAFNSGADEAILYDSLGEIRATHKYAAISSRMLASTIFLCALGGIVGSWAHSIHYRIPWILATTLMALRVPLVFLLAETPRIESVRERRRLWPVLMEALQAYELRWIVCAWCLINAFAHSMLWIYQPYLAALKIDLVWNGVVFAALNVVASLSSWAAPRLLRRFDVITIFNFLGLLVAGSLFVMGVAFTYWGVLSFSAHQVLRGLGRVVLQNEVQKDTPSSHRASVASCIELTTRLSYTLVLIPLGCATDWWGMGVTLHGSGLILTVGLCILWSMLPEGGQAEVQEVATTS